MKIALIGAGNLATVLGHALCNARHDIVQVYSHTMTAANLLAEKLNAAPTDSLDTITNDADLYIIAVRDSVLDAVIGRLCPNRTEKLFVHTAGSVPIDVFRGRARRFGVLYPMQTFSKTRIVDFRNIPVFIEADSPVLFRPPLPAFGCRMGMQLYQFLLRYGSRSAAKGGSSLRYNVAIDR